MLLVERLSGNDDVRTGCYPLWRRAPLLSVDQQLSLVTMVLLLFGSNGTIDFVRYCQNSSHDLLLRFMQRTLRYADRFRDEL